MRLVGCIINVSSLLGVKGGKGSTAYAASKAGIIGMTSAITKESLLLLLIVIGLTRSLAAEVGPMSVRVNAIVPGYIETQMTEGVYSLWKPS